MAILDSFSQFLGQKKKISWKIWLCHTTSYEFLSPCQNLKKLDDIIQRKQTEGQTEGQMEGRTELMEGRTDRQTLFYRTLPATAGGPKSMNKEVVE